MLNAMATNQSFCIQADDDYIDMEVMSPSSNFICYSISSPPQSREFEFQMCSVSLDKETTTCPADELFYKGKLLPLHLPPRLLMVQKLLQNPISTTTTTTTFDNKTEKIFEENYVIPFITRSTTPSTNTNTPLESCNISPTESCRPSCELNPDEYFFEWSTEVNNSIGDNPKKPRWTKKLKQSLLGQKLKASTAYFKSLFFSKSGCADDSCVKPARYVAEEETVSKVAKKNPFGTIDNERYSKISNTLKRSVETEMAEDDFCCQRRSFSGAIQWHSASKSSSSSSSGSSSASSSFSLTSSNGFSDLQSLKRSCSANTEIESSIEGAIAYCKKSQHLISSRKSSNEVGVCSFSAPGIAAL